MKKKPREFEEILYLSYKIDLKRTLINNKKRDIYIFLSILSKINVASVRNSIFFIFILIGH